MYDVVQYKNSVKRGMKDHETKNEAVSDWLLGLIGETSEMFDELELTFTKGEATPADIALELGDVCWYFTALILELGLDVDMGVIHVEVKDEDKNIYQPAKGLIDITLELAELLKHYLFHKERKLRGEIEKKLEQYWGNLNYLSSVMYMDLMAILKLNDEKLQYRYGDAYDDDSSKNRHKKEVPFVETEVCVELVKRVLVNA